MLSSPLLCHPTHFPDSMTGADLKLIMCAGADLHHRTPRRQAGHGGSDQLYQPQPQHLRFPRPRHPRPLHRAADQRHARLPQGHGRRCQPPYGTGAAGVSGVAVPGMVGLLAWPSSDMLHGQIQEAGVRSLPCIHSLLWLGSLVPRARSLTPELDCKHCSSRPKAVLHAPHLENPNPFQPSSGGPALLAVLQTFHSSARCQTTAFPPTLRHDVAHVAAALACQ